MRFDKIVCSSAALFAGAAATLLLSSSSVSAISVLKPTDGQVVRDKVSVVIPKSSVSSEVLSAGFIVIKVDGNFVSAVGTNLENKIGKEVDTDNIIYTWDSKRIINDPSLGEDLRSYRDGSHEITVEGHGPDATGKEKVLETATVKVTLQNNIPQSNPPEPIRLKYHNTIGKESEFKFTAAGDVYNIAGLNMSGGQFPILGEFSMTQSVEDIQPDGSVMYRYKVKDDGFNQIFGSVYMLRQLATPFRSVYKIVSNTGRVIEDNVLAQRVEAKVGDCLIWLPDRPIQIGQSWGSSFRLRFEGMMDVTTFSGTSKLEALEWESGQKCAKIVSDWKGIMDLKIPEPASAQAANTGYGNAGYSMPGLGTPGADGTGKRGAKAPAPKPKPEAKVKSIAYFAYGTGKLLKNTMIIEFSDDIDNSLIAAMQHKVSLKGDAETGDSSDSTGSEDGSTGYDPMTGSTYNPQPTGGNTNGGRSERSAKTPVKIRLTIVEQKVR